MSRALRQGVGVGCWCLAAGCASLAWGQYQDVTSQNAASLIPNNRTQANISNQGTGYSSSQYYLYGPYYNQTLNKANNAKNAGATPFIDWRQQGQFGGRPNRGWSWTDEQAAELHRRQRARRVAAAEALGVAVSDSDGRCVVSSVRKDSSLDRAGLKTGDQIVSLNGKSVSSPDDFHQVVSTINAEQKVPIDVIRGDRKVTLNWTPQADELKQAEAAAERASLPVSPTESSSVGVITAAPLRRNRRGQTYLGVELDPRISNRAVVTSVVSGSPADEAGLRPGDTISSVSGMAVRSPQDLYPIVAHSTPGVAVYLYVVRPRTPTANLPAPAPAGANRP
jgi:predicted metalloprotease with PDZ domain